MRPGERELVRSKVRGLDLDTESRSEEAGPATGADDGGKGIAALASQLGQTVDQQWQGDVEDIDASTRGDLLPRQP